MQRKKTSVSAQRNGTPDEGDEDDQNSTSITNHIRYEMMKQVDGAPIALWRIGFGLCFMKHNYDILSQDMLRAFFWFSQMNFKYCGFGWVTPLPASYLELLVMFNILCSFFFVIGFKTKFCTLYMFFNYLYIFLLEKAWYVNHHYLHLLLLVVFYFTNCERGVLTLDSYLHSKTTSSTKVPKWQLLWFQALFCIVYFYAGIAKVQTDWILRAEPLRTWFFVGNPFYRTPMVFPYTQEPIVTFFSFCGSFFGIGVDLIGSIMLMFKNTRMTALLFQVTFHTMNQMFFDIGTFPLMMLLSSVLWVEPETCISIAQRLRLRRSGTSAAEKDSEKKIAGWEWRTTVMLIMLAIQVLLPLRPYLLSDPNWTNESHYFSWRMMLNEEDTLVKFWGTDATNPNGTVAAVSPGTSLTDYQRWQMKKDPVMLVQFAHSFVKPFLTDHFHFKNPSINIEVWRRPFQRWMNEETNVLNIDPFSNPFLNHNSWILPQIEEVNALSWLRYQKEIALEWKKEGYEVLFFADIPNHVWEAAFEKNFAERIVLVPLLGHIQLEVEGEEGFAELVVGQQYLIEPIQYHTLTNIGTGPSCWMYAWKNPRMSFDRAINMF